MSLENQQKYVETVAAVIAKKILSMNNINKTDIDVNNINLLVHKAANDLLLIGYICYGEDGLFDEFTAGQLDSNCRVGELQIYFDEYCGTKINIDRFGVDDLSDLDIKLVNKTGDFLIVVIESKLGKTIQIKSSSKELRFQEGTLRILDHNGMHEFIDVKDIKLEKAVELFKTDINSLYSNNLLEDIETRKSHSIR